MNHNKHHQSETRANVKNGSTIYLKANTFGWGQFQIGVRYISHHTSAYPERIRSFRSWRLVHAVSIFNIENWMLACSVHPIIFLQNMLLKDHLTKISSNLHAIKHLQWKSWWSGFSMPFFSEPWGWEVGLANQWQAVTPIGSMGRLYIYLHENHKNHIKINLSCR